jgi:hypothetical protein
MHLCRCLSFITAKFNVNLFASHIRVKDNTLADALSHQKTDYFFANCPQSQPSHTRIPSELLDLLILDKLDWRSPHWIKLWTSISTWFSSKYSQSTCVYASAQKCYLEFCSLHKLHTLPASEQQVCQPVSSQLIIIFVIHQHLSSLRLLYIANSLPDPKTGDMPKLEQVLRGVKQEQAHKNPKRPQRLPITPSILRKIRSVWGKK